MKFTIEPIRSLSLVMLVAALSGCASLRQISAHENGGQSHLRLEVRSAVIDPSTLSPKDTVVIGQEAEKMQVAASNPVKVFFYESTATPLGLGIPDFDLRFGRLLKPQEATAASKSGAAEKAPASRLVTIKQFAVYDGAAQTRWLQQGGFELGEKEIIAGFISLRYRIVTVNTGDKAFSGKLVIHDRLSGNHEFVSLENTSTVTDQRTGKAVMSLIPIVGIFTENMDDYRSNPNTALNGKSSFDPKTGIFRYEIDNIEIPTGSGVELTLKLKALLPRDEELLKARLQNRMPQQ